MGALTHSLHYYVIIPSFVLLKDIPLFPESLGGIAFWTHIKGWWSEQRMWMIRRVTSYLFAIIDTFLRFLGLSAMEFAITSKVSDEDESESRRYEQEVMEFGSSSLEFMIIATAALLNLACLMDDGLCRILVGGWNTRLDMFFLQIDLCGALVATNIPTKRCFKGRTKGDCPCL